MTFVMTQIPHDEISALPLGVEALPEDHLIFLDQANVDNWHLFIDMATDNRCPECNDLASRCTACRLR